MGRDPAERGRDASSQWTWTNEFRRLLGYRGEGDFPTSAGPGPTSAPDDSGPTFAAFNAALKKSGGRYDVTYRLRTAGGAYRWFRATGGVVRDGSGRAVRACGSLVDIHDATVVAEAAKQRAEKLGVCTSTFDRDMSALTQTVEDAAKQFESTSKRLAESAANASKQTGAVSAAAEKAGANVIVVAGAAEELGSSVAEIRRQVEHSTDMSRDAVKEADTTAGIVAELSQVAGGIAARW